MERLFFSSGLLARFHPSLPAKRHRSILNNSTNQLRGNLVATETRFLQVLEGAPEPTRSAYERIAADVRHDQVNLLTNELEDALFDSGELAAGTHSVIPTKIRTR